MEYEKCLVEVGEILKHLKVEELSKIPKDIIELVNEKKDKEYVWHYEESKTLNEQNLDRGTIAILSYLNMEYLLNEEQKLLMKEIHKHNEDAIRKKHNFNKNEVSNREEPIVLKDNNEKMALAELKSKKWYKRIFLFMRNMFSKA